MDSFKIKIVLWTVGLWIAVVLAQEPSILTAQGEIRGIRRPSNKRATVLAFLGIPYA